ncbi:hypothetical protein [Pseudemcibacter aquimaris]|uniref:hypothetical protein n=1 Tax=Pseudemcibacter aquimaris TaxID=2857064 RepID=UPI0020117BC7|nr:hypothetical protein [Pseudemcibacter aquimaris]MCC3861012.1 hypothetical protein [Pseudemcibacter aquimaris]WDU59830.1 hypothetical protein KW060_06120 [Pseudemcibacter aquimaris]
MFKTFTLLALFFSVVFNSAYAEEKLHRNYYKILRDGKYDEQIEIAHKIREESVYSKSIEKTLLRLLKRSKDKKSSKAFLETYISIVDDPSKHNKAYKEYIDNAFNLKARRGDSFFQLRSSFLLGLADIEIIPESLLDFLLNPKGHKNLSESMRYGILREIFKNDPKKAERIVPDLNKNPEAYLSLLREMSAEDLKLYEVEIRNVSERAPSNALYILQKAKLITEQEIDLALKTVRPFELSQLFLEIKDNNDIAVELLLEYSAQYPKAKNKIFELIGNGNFFLVKKALKNKSLDDFSLKSDLLKLLMEKLADTKFQNPIFVSNICSYLDNFDISNSDYIDTLVYRSRFSRTALESASCTLALNNVTKLTPEMKSYIEQVSNYDLEVEIEKIEKLAENTKPMSTYMSFSGGNLYSYDVYNPVNGPNFSLLYLAGLMLEHSTEKAKALEIIYRYHNAKVAFVPHNDDFQVGLSSMLNIEIPVKILGTRSRINYIIDVTPMNLIANYLYEKDYQKWEDFIFENLKSDDEHKLINASILIDQFKVGLPETFTKVLIANAKEYESSKVAYIRALKYVTDNPEKITFLKNEAEDERSPYKNLSAEILGYKKE